jgi:hypothetical protein
MAIFSNLLVTLIGYKLEQKWPKNIKNLRSVTNTLTYCARPSVTMKIGFITSTPGAKAIECFNLGMTQIS